MRLTPTERDRLLLFSAAELARARKARGLRLNVPEATALIADTVCEAARDGRRLADAIERARSVLGPDDVLPGVADVVTEVHVEAVFDDGSRLAVVSDPIGGGLAGDAPGALLPGPVHAEPEAVVRVTVTNTATVPVSVTSHFHFFEANPRLDFDRAAGYGCGWRCPRARRCGSGRGVGAGRTGADRRSPHRHRLRRPRRRTAGRAGRPRGGASPRRRLRLSGRRARCPGERRGQR